MGTIVFIINDLGFGGAQRTLIDKTKILMKLGYKIEIIVLYTFNNAHVLNAQFDEDVNIRLLSLKRTKLNKLKGIIYIYKNLKTINPLLIFTYLNDASIYGRIANIFLGYPLINSYRNVLRKKSNKMIRIEKYLIPFTSCYTAISKSVKNDVVKAIGMNENKVVIHYNPVNFTRFYRNTGIEKKEIIISVGRLGEQKAHDLLIKSFNRVSNKYKNIDLHIYGEGEDEQKLMSLVKNLDLTNRVYFKGIVNNIEDIYNESIFSVISSRWEGFCMAMIESLSCGTPVVSTKVAGPDEVIVDYQNGFLSDIDDEEKLAFNMDKLLYIYVNNKKKYHEISIGASNSSKQFSYEAHENILKNLISNYGRTN